MSAPKHEEIDAARRQSVRGLVHAIDDTGGDQVVTVETHSSVVRSQVPVHQPFGFSAHCPADGAVTVLHSMGGDGGDQVALPPANPQAAHFGNLGEGESVLYDGAGQRVHLRNGQIVEIDALAEFTVSVGGTVIFQIAIGTVTITGKLQVNGAINATADIVAGNVSLQQHVHGGVQSGASETGEPVV